MRKTTATFMALFALVLVAGCGASGGSDGADTTTTTGTTSAPETTTTTAEATTTTTAEETTTTSSSSDAVPVTAWADDFCGSFSSWTDDVKSLGSGVEGNITPGDLEGAKTTIVGFFDDVSGRTQQLIDDVDGAGVPDIKDGDQLVKDLQGKFQEFDDAIASARSDIEGVDTGDAQAFQAQVKSSLNDFQTEATKVGNSFSELDAKYPSRELNDAINSSCNF